MDRSFGEIAAEFERREPMLPLSDVSLLEEDEAIDCIGDTIIAVLSGAGGGLRLHDLLLGVTARTGVSEDDVRVALARLTGRQVAPGTGSWIELASSDL
ncbi:hypothetical protein AB0M54_32045 [Actinoplanes sp. NPDC051470]|uniref:hypothetical protein n=1 Tax=unclassified Actinoplanes TaxID=2626549 RepID=UPI003412E9FF